MEYIGNSSFTLYIRTTRVYVFPKSNENFPLSLCPLSLFWLLIITSENNEIPPKVFIQISRDCFKWHHVFWDFGLLYIFLYAENRWLFLFVWLIIYDQCWWHYFKEWKIGFRNMSCWIRSTKLSILVLFAFLEYSNKISLDE